MTKSRLECVDCYFYSKIFGEHKRKVSARVDNKVWKRLGIESFQFQENLIRRSMLEKIRSQNKNATFRYVECLFQFILRGEG